MNLNNTKLTDPTNPYIPAVGDHVIYETPETIGGYYEGNIIETKNGLVIKPVNKNMLTFGVSDVYVWKFRRFVKIGNFSQEVQYENNTPKPKHYLKDLINNIKIMWHS